VRAQELLPVLDGRVQREEAGGAGQGRPQLRGDHVRGHAQPREPQHGVLRQPGRRLRTLLRRRHAAAAGLPQLVPAGRSIHRATGRAASTAERRRAYVQVSRRPDS
jgi:hypothetical protein